MESEISGLADLHAYMKYQNYVTRFSFPYFDMPEVAERLRAARERPDDKLPYEPKRVRKPPSADLVELKQAAGTLRARVAARRNLRRSQQIEPELPWLRADDEQNLILRG